MNRSQAQIRVFYLLLGSLMLAIASRAEADEGEGSSDVELRLHLDGGAGMHESSLPSADGVRKVAPTWFPAAGFRFALSQAPGSRLRFGGELQYASSVGYELTRDIAPETTESSAGRAQEFGVFASMAIALQDGRAPISVPIALGYAGSAFTTDTPLTAAQAYLISGPRAAVGIDVPLFAARLRVSARGELGANVTATQALKSSGVDTFGLAYGFTAAADVRIANVLLVGASYRESRVELSHAGSSNFHELHRFVLASLTLSNAR